MSKVKTYKDVKNTVEGFVTSIDNTDWPSSQQHIIECPEFTFLGAVGQPDFGHLTIKMIDSYGNGIELKSLKKYLYQYRDVIISYERCSQLIYQHIMESCEPADLWIEISLLPRGGISSTITNYGARGY